MYHDGNRELQDAFGSRALADRYLTTIHRNAFTEADRGFIEAAGFFFLATADAEGRPDCSFKGGPPGFVRVSAAAELRFPDFDGNGMFKSLGNIRANPHVGLLFIAMGEAPRRLRVNGRARVETAPGPEGWPHGAQLLVVVEAVDIFPNCPRYIPDLAAGTASKYLPEPGRDPVEPGWKSFEHFRDLVPGRRT